VTEAHPLGLGVVQGVAAALEGTGLRVPVTVVEGHPEVVGERVVEAELEGQCEAEGVALPPPGRLADKYAEAEGV